MKTNIHIITHPIRKGVVFHKTLCPNYNSHIIIPDGKIVTRLLPQIPKEPCPKTRRPNCSFGLYFFLVSSSFWSPCLWRLFWLWFWLRLFSFGLFVFEAVCLVVSLSSGLLVFWSLGLLVSLSFGLYVFDMTRQGWVGQGNTSQG
jgi:hypothetical protein